MLMLTWWAFAVALLSRQLPEVMVARVLGTLGLVAFGFLLFILMTSSPFERLLPGAAEGRDLNPAAPGSGAGHPPAAALHGLCRLLGGLRLRHRRAAVGPARRRLGALVATVDDGGLVFLTLGIAMGSWWAYYELGWGGWWFWDPVENASFMPWLAGTALIHSLAVTEKRGSFKNWTVLLAISAFSLSLLGTFLVRSGVLTSVHAFATDPRRGVFILIFLVAVIGSSLALFAWRAPKVGLGGRFALVSRESLLLTNNVLLVVACATVLLGTLYPLLIDALGAGKISVGPPYFNAVFVPLMTPILFLMGVAPFARWKEASVPEIARAVRWALLPAVVVAIALPLIYGSLVGVDRARPAAGGVDRRHRPAQLRRTRAAHARRPILPGRRAEQPRHFFGMHLAHIGIAVFVVGVTMVSSFQEEKDVKMAPGESVDVAGYHFTFKGVRGWTDPITRRRGASSISRSTAASCARCTPEKRNYHSSAMPMTEAAIDAGVLRDVYVSLGEPIDRARPEGEWAVRVYYKPFVDWIWGGCVLMALGGLVAMLDRRYRIRSRAAATVATPAGSQQA
jgi:cytochrome c-type biogenesis protein CcmF